MPLPADVARRVSFRVQQDRQGRILRVHRPQAPKKGEELRRHCNSKACPCHSNLVKEMRACLGPAEGAAVDRLLDDRHCWKIWPQVEPHIALALIATTLDAWSGRRAAGPPAVRRKDRHAGWLRAAAFTDKIRRYIARYGYDIEMHRAAQAAPYSSEGVATIRPLEEAINLQWQATLGEIAATFREAARSRGATDDILSPPVPPLHKWHASAETRYVVLKLLRALRDDECGRTGGLGIKPGQHYKFTGWLASAVLELADDKAVDELRVREILDADSKRRRRQKADTRRRK